MILKKTLNLNKFDFYVKHISIINALFIPDKYKLTLKEIEVVACFMKHGENLDPEYLLSTINRKKVMTEMNISNGGLTNYVTQLKNKKAITVDNKFHKVFNITDFNSQEYNITLNNTSNNGN